MKSFKFIALCTMLVVSSLYCKASHILSMHCTYEYVAIDSYRVNLVLSRDCQGLSLPLSVPIQVHSPSLGLTTSYTLSAAGSVVQAAGGCLLGTTCTNIFSTIPGVEYQSYTGIVYLQSGTNDFQFSYSDCCRSAAVLNTSGGSAVNSWLDRSTGANNAPVFSNSYSYIVQANGVATTFSLGAYEPDGDSLVYSTRAPIQSIFNGAQTAATYNSGYSVANPLGTGGSASINPSTGDITVLSATAGTYVLVVEVKEYRNGVYIGSTMQDFTVMFTAGTNVSPTLSGINGGTAITLVHAVCPSSAVAFTINSSDANAADSTFLTLVSNSASGTFTTTATQQQSGTYTWTPTVGDVRTAPYAFTFMVSDNACPQGVSSRTFLVYLIQCNTDTVWPGDANADFIVNNIDFLSLGLANGKTGSVRAGANGTWTPQYCPNWATSFTNTVNHKHADCDGNGSASIVTDAAAISSNYGQWHNKTRNAGRVVRGVPELWAQPTTTIAPGSKVSFDLKLGSVTNTCADFYGIASSVTTNKPNFVDSIVVRLGASTWSSDVYAFSKKISSNRVDLAVSKSNGSGLTSYGNVAVIDVYLKSEAVVGDSIQILLEDTKVIAASEQSIVTSQPVNRFQIVSPQSIADAGLAALSVFPNPALSYIEVANPLGIAFNGKVMDAKGVLVASFTESVHRLDVSTLPYGTYLVTIQQADGLRTHIVLQHR
jgi:hypothetical protein